MPYEGLTQLVKITQVIPCTTAGSSDTIISSVIDTQAFDANAFLLSVGTVAAATTTGLAAGRCELDIQESTLGTTNSTDWGTIDGAAVGPVATSDSNKTLIIDIRRGSYRYLRCRVIRESTDGPNHVAIGGVWALQTGSSVLPTTQGSGILETMVIDGIH